MIDGSGGRALPLGGRAEEGGGAQGMARSTRLDFSATL